MLNKFVHYLLSKLSKSLLKYNHSIESYLTKNSLADKSSVSEILTNTPPAHWLEKVRQGAPHLLQQMQYDIETDLSPSDNLESESQLSKPKHKPLFKKFAFLAKHIHKKTSLFLKSKKTYLASNQASILTPVTAPKHLAPSDSKLQLKKTFHFINAAITKNTPPPFQEKNPLQAKPNKIISPATSHANINKQYVKNNPLMDEKLANTHKQPLKTSKADRLKENKTHKKSPILHLYPKAKTTITGTQPIPSNQSKTVKLQGKASTLVLPNKTKLLKIKENQIKPKKVTSTTHQFATPDLSIPFDNKKIISDLHPLPKNRTSTDKTSLKTDDSFSKRNDPPPIFDKTKFNAIDQSSFITEVQREQTETEQEHWPTLANKENTTTSDSFDQPFRFWKIQQLTKSNYLRDQEQRGTSWNA